ncbi:hypothetical protein JW859_03600 [bacterium]|nr:hypothetical protein [bacterium]
MPAYKTGAYRIPSSRCRPWTVSTVVLILLALLSGGGCSSGNAGSDALAPTGGTDQQPAVTDGFGSFLGSPSQYAHEPDPNRQARYVTDDLIVDADEYESSCPYLNITDEILGEITFQPYWTPADPDPDHLAYCMYRFHAVDYDREPMFGVIWTDYYPSDPAVVWIGAANWDADSWDWYQADEDGFAAFPSMAPYDHFGDFLFVMLICGTEYCKMYKAVLGPQTNAVLYANKDQGLAPLTVGFNAAASEGLVFSANKFQWDWDGDGTFEEDTGATSVVSHTFADTGAHTVTVRVGDSIGYQWDTDAVTVYVRPSWAHSWGGDAIEVVQDLAVAGDAVYLAGFLNQDSDSDLLVAKCDLAGNLAWARSWGAAEYDGAIGITVSDNGDVYIAGATNSYGAGAFDIFLQRWTPAGGLVWTKTWGGVDNETIGGIAAYDGYLYVAGGTHSFSDLDGDSLLIKFGEDGSESWARTWGGADGDLVNDIVVTYDSIYGFMYIHLVGTTQAPSSKYQLTYTKFTRDGECVDSGNLAGADSLTGTSLAATGVLNSDLYFCGDMYSTEGHLFVAMIDGGALAMAKSLDAAYQTAGLDLAYHADDGIVVCGTQQAPMFTTTGLLFSMSTAGALQGAKAWIVDEDLCELTAIKPFPGSGFLLGGKGSMADGGCWVNTSLTVADLDATWTSFLWTAYSVSGTMGNVAQTAVDITSGGTTDSGGGSSDCLLFARTAP